MTKRASAVQAPEKGELLVPEIEPAPVQHDGPTESVGSPGKVMRIGSMVKQLLDEVRAAPLDERSRARLANIYEQSVTELASSLSPDLQQELRSLAHPFSDDVVPTDAELPVMTIDPASVTEPPAILPPTAIVKPTPALDNVPSLLAFSAMLVLKPLPPSTSSDTRARMT